MARTMHLPSERELPPGPVRDFAELLFWLYRRAHRPALRDISERIRRNDDLHGTASPETIRRMLLGTTVPVKWAIVEAVYLTLCDLAEMDPFSKKVRLGEDVGSVRSFVEDAWHNVLDNPDQSFRQPASRDGAEFDPSGGPPGWDDDDI
jgi:hypothetical protein